MPNCLMIPDGFHYFLDHLELLKFPPNLASYTSFFITKLLQKIREIMESSLQILFFHISRFRNSKIPNFRHYRTSNMWNLFVSFFLKSGGSKNNWYLQAFSKNFRAWNLAICGQSFLKILKHK